MKKQIGDALGDLDARVQTAVVKFWQTREQQLTRQRRAGRADAGARGAATGGAQMDGFVGLLRDLLVETGTPEECVHRSRGLTHLPGYYRATKQWDLVVVVQGRLVLAVEAKSQVGSFGNNLNNRTEEAVGSSVDLWTAYREGALGESPRPWLGYLFLLEDCPASAMPVAVKEPHYRVFAEFRDASYSQRYEVLCRRLMRERNYDAAAFLLTQQTGRVYREPARDLRMSTFVRSLLAHALSVEGVT